MHRTKLFGVAIQPTMQFRGVETAVQAPPAPSSPATAPGSLPSWGTTEARRRLEIKRVRQQIAENAAKRARDGDLSQSAQPGLRHKVTKTWPAFFWRIEKQTCTDVNEAGQRAARIDDHAAVT